MVDFSFQKKQMPLLTPSLGCLSETPALYSEGREEEREKDSFLSTAMLNCVIIGLHCDITMLNCDIIIIVPLRSRLCIIVTF